MTDDTLSDEPEAPVAEQPKTAEVSDDTAPVADEADEAADPDEATEAADPDEALRQKYRDALAHKHGSSGATKKGHGDAGSSGQSQSSGPTQRMFRRKAGG